jgi:hypothetical protein
MQGIEREYCNVCINALIGAWQELMEVSFVETLRNVRYGKGDTLGLDAIPELNISRRLKDFDQHSILITEELDDLAHRRWPTGSDPITQPLMFFCDPTDRSHQLNSFFSAVSKEKLLLKVGTVMKDCNPEEVWEKMFEAPVSITGATGAITCVRKGEVVFSVIFNYITSTVIVATDLGIYWHKFEDFSALRNVKITLDDIVREGKALGFPGIRDLGYSLDDCRHFVTFLGSEKKMGYKENFKDSMIFVDDPNGFLHHSQPPGPPRVLYLSEFQKDNGPIGFILSNGEKIGEWMHWLSFVKYAKNNNGGRALKVFEISLERPWTKEGMLMSTSVPYSVFCENDEGERYLDISRLRNFLHPSHFRSMIVVLPYDNERIIHVMEQHQYREVTEFF